MEPARRGGRNRQRTATRPIAGTTGGVVRALGPLEPWSADQVEAVHRAALRVLAELGVEFLGTSARDAFRRARAEVDEATRMVRFPPGLVDELLATAPSAYTLRSRNPARTLQIGGDVTVFGLTSGPPHVHDRIRGRRSGNLADYADLIRLGQCFDVIHYVGNQPIAPVELPAETRHLDCYLANILNTDKVFGANGIGRDRALDGITMVAMARGCSLDDLLAEPGTTTVVNCNSPRRYDEPMTDGLMVMAEHGQAVVVTPFTLMGAMAAVSPVAALVQQHAEALAGIALTQIVRPGTPVAYGAFTSNVDLKSGAPAFGTPENVRATLAAGQLARRVGLPYRASNASASTSLDAQAAYESQASLWASVMGGANMVYHAAGWMEGGLIASFEKIVIDVEILQEMAEIVQPFPIDEADDSVAMIAEVAPGGHFFGSSSTLQRYGTAFYAPLVSDWRGIEAWTAAGSPDAAERATKIWQERLAAFEPPPLDPGAAEALMAYVTSRKRAIGRAAA